MEPRSPCMPRTRRGCGDDGGDDGDGGGDDGG